MPSESGVAGLGPVDGDAATAVTRPPGAFRARTAEDDGGLRMTVQLATVLGLFAAGPANAWLCAGLEGTDVAVPPRRGRAERGEEAERQVSRCACRRNTGPE